MEIKEVEELRKREKMTECEFAFLMGLPVKTYRSLKEGKKANLWITKEKIERIFSKQK